MVADLVAILTLYDLLAPLLPEAALSLDTGTGHPWALPPAVVVGLGAETVVFDRVRSLDLDTLRRRGREVHERYGETARHWWVFDQADRLNFRHTGTVRVRPGREHATHLVIRPTSAQREIAAAGGQVCWLASSTLLLPYGAHTFTYDARDGEDWSGKMASWQRDWRISQPQPGPGAAWWGLVSMPLAEFARGDGLLVPHAAHRVMAAVESVQPGRERYRRRLARDQQTRLATFSAEDSSRVAEHADGGAEAPSDLLGETEVSAQPTDAPEVPAAPVVPPQPSFPPDAARPSRLVRWREVVTRWWKK